MSCQRVLPDALPPGDVVERTDHLHLQPVPRLVGSARRFVAERLPDLPAEVVDALLLMTSELVTHAVLHARTPIELGITVSRESVLVTVHDLDLARPSQQPYAGREGGWGLGLVAALAQGSAMDSDPEGGKTAWFRLARTGAPDVQDGAAARLGVPGRQAL